MKESKVTSNTIARTYEGKHGQIFIHNIVMENGDTGEYHSKTAEIKNFKPGEVQKYESTQRNYQGNAYNVFKPAFDKPFQEGGKSYKRQESMEERFIGYAGRWATDMVLASDEYSQHDFKPLLKHFVTSMLEVYDEVKKAPESAANTPPPHDKAPPMMGEEKQYAAHHDPSSHDNLPGWVTE
jgi:hypothetical protein